MELYKYSSLHTYKKQSIYMENIFLSWINKNKNKNKYK